MHNIDVRLLCFTLQNQKVQLGQTKTSDLLWVEIKYLKSAAMLFTKQTAIAWSLIGAFK